MSGITSGGRSPRRRLLLTNYDVGADLPSGSLQLGLNFADSMPELFSGKEMGEDAMLVLNDYLKLNGRIQKALQREVPVIRAALQRVSQKKQ